MALEGMKIEPVVSETDLECLREMEYNLGWIENKYPNNPWPRMAIESYREFIKNPNNENHDKANGTYKMCAPLFYEAINR